MAAVKITGKGGGGDAGGGQGRSRLEQLFDEFLRRPSPATARLFKEMLDVADPSQTLFGGDSKTGAANQQAFTRSLHTHIARLHRQAQQPVGVRNAASLRRNYNNLRTMVETLSGAGAALGPEGQKAMLAATAGYKSYRGKFVQSQVRERSATASLAQKQIDQAAIVAQERAARAEAKSKERTAREEARNKARADKEAARAANALPPYLANAARLRNGMLSSSASGLEGALASGFGRGSLREFRDQHSALRKLERNADKQVKLLSRISGTDEKELQLAKQHATAARAARQYYGRQGQARWGAKATRPRMGALIGEAAETMGISSLADPAMFFGAAAMAGLGGVWEGANMLNSVVGSQKPYMDPLRSFARLSRRLGYGQTGRAMMAPFYGGGATPAWMARLGLTPNEVGAYLGQYGLRLGAHGGGDKRFVQGLRRMQLHDPYMPFTMKQMVGIAQTSSVYGLAAPGSKEMLRQYQKVIYEGTKQGIDSATSIRVMSGTMKTMADNMAFGQRGGGHFASFVSGLMKSGFTSMRTGAGEASITQNMLNDRNNLLSNPFLATTLMQMSGGGAEFKSRAGLAKMFGRSWMKHQMATPQGRKLIKTAVSLAKSNPLLGFAALRSIIPTEALYRDLNTTIAGQYGGDTAINQLIRSSALMGGNMSSQIAAESALKYHLSPAGRAALARKQATGSRLPYMVETSQVSALLMKRAHIIANEATPILQAMDGERFALEKLGGATTKLTDAFENLFRTILHQSRRHATRAPLSEEPNAAYAAVIGAVVP